jgi:hypothetical protein
MEGRILRIQSEILSEVSHLVVCYTGKEVSMDPLHDAGILSDDCVW